MDAAERRKSLLRAHIPTCPISKIHVDYIFGKPAQRKAHVVARGPYSLQGPSFIKGLQSNPVLLVQWGILGVYGVCGNGACCVSERGTRERPLFLCECCVHGCGGVLAALLSLHIHALPTHALPPLPPPPHTLTCPPCLPPSSASPPCWDPTPQTTTTPWAPPPHPLQIETTPTAAGMLDCLHTADFWCRARC